MTHSTDNATVPKPLRPKQGNCQLHVPVHVEKLARPPLDLGSIREPKAGGEGRRHDRSLRIPFHSRVKIFLLLGHSSRDIATVKTSERKGDGFEQSVNVNGIVLLRRR